MNYIVKVWKPNKTFQSEKSWRYTKKRATVGELETEIIGIYLFLELFSNKFKDLRYKELYLSANFLPEIGFLEITAFIFR